VSNSFGGAGGPSDRAAREPAINLPPVTLWLIVINLAIHAFREFLLPDDFNAEFTLALAFIPVRYTVDVDAVGGGLITTLLDPITFQFLHAGWLHVGINVATLAAFGAPIERVLGGRLYLVFYLLCGALSAFGHMALNLSSSDPVVGASGGISGLFGAVLMMLALRGGLRSMLPVIAIVVALNVGMGLWGVAPGAESYDIAWEAHVAGLIAGLALIRPFLRRAYRK
jgi:membrane associated rhomboid family serine protease